MIYHLARTSLIALIFLLAGAAIGAESAAVGVEYVNLLALSTGSGITLIATESGLVSCPDGAASAILRYSHNSTTSKKIVAGAEQISGGPNDVTLFLIVEGCAPALLVDNGVPRQDVVLWDDISAGGYTKAVTWRATGSPSGATGDQPCSWAITVAAPDH